MLSDEQHKARNDDSLDILLTFPISRWQDQPLYFALDKRIETLIVVKMWCSILCVGGKELVLNPVNSTMLESESAGKSVIKEKASIGTEAS